MTSGWDDSLLIGQPSTGGGKGVPCLNSNPLPGGHPEGTKVHPRGRKKLSTCHSSQERPKKKVRGGTTRRPTNFSSSDRHGAPHPKGPRMRVRGPAPFRPSTSTKGKRYLPV